MAAPLEGPQSLNHERQLAEGQLGRHRFYCDECRTSVGWCPVGNIWATARDELAGLYETAKDGA